MAVVLAPELKVKIRHHGGYLNVEEAQTFVLGTPAAVQTQFIIEGAMNRLLPEALPLVERLVAELDEMECKIDESFDNVTVNQVGNIQIRPDAFRQQVLRYEAKRNALMQAFGCYPNPYDQRPWLSGGSDINVPVNH
jgi:hypothetical protein